MPPDITLIELAGLIGGEVVGDGTVPILNVTHDSRGCRTGTLFVAIRGFEADGHSYVDNAIANGAAAICVDHLTDVNVPQLVVEDTRLALGPISSVLYGRPTEHVPVIGVTGTNGKTTVTHLLEAIGTAAGRNAAVIGTIGARVAGERIPLERTTPEASELQALFAEMRKRSVDLVAMEVSSHSLALHRVDGTHFQVVAFTNLSQDHLDFHKDMDTYFAAKAQLFSAARADKAVIFTDDPYGAHLASTIDLPVMRVGFDAAADIRAESVITSTSHSDFTIVTEQQSCPVRLGLGGSFNVANALVATGCALGVGISIEDIVEGLEAIRPVLGRFEVVSTGHPISVIVDYAHTPDGIRAVIEAARMAAPGRVIVVVGAGGDRDQSKRAAMGTAASAADLVIVTSDNPRSEDPAVIAEAVRSGIAMGDPIIELDRRKAIFNAVRVASEGDVVLVLGKGHETTQAFKDRTVHFDDREVARAALEARQ
ncbi:MAG: UDP-N-acetylmuramoyl-L-alanyl-D-glutamate--2,6-diaminopimelate ligase [Acidimicrobiia bacterium]